nr:thioredoxin family protein [Desulfolithobacter dissulfuricans]
MEIKVCGPGCASCQKAQEVVEAAVAAKGVDATVTKVTDFQEIAKMGIFSTPAVVVNGEVKCVGRPRSRPKWRSGSVEKGCLFRCRNSPPFHGGLCPFFIYQVIFIYQ